MDKATIRMMRKAIFDHPAGELFHVAYRFHQLALMLAETVENRFYLG